MSDSELITALVERFEKFKAELDQETRVELSNGAAPNGASTEIADGS